jgi:hypothetical protein
MSYFFFKNRGTEGNYGRNSNKDSELLVPLGLWDKVGHSGERTLGQFAILRGSTVTIFES